MSTNYSYLLHFSVIHLRQLSILANNRLLRKGTMRILKREVEGGITIADWHGGFIGISRSRQGWRKASAWFERCPCCEGAFDLTVEFLGLELMAYNDGGSCELEAYVEDFQHDMTSIQPIG
jgi:hypothetical protein